MLKVFTAIYSNDTSSNNTYTTYGEALSSICEILNTTCNGYNIIQIEHSPKEEAMIISGTISVLADIHFAHTQNTPT